MAGFLAGTSFKYNGGGTPGPNTPSPGIDTRTATLLVAITCGINSAEFMRDSKSNTWIKKTEQSANSSRMGAIHYCISPTGDISHTFDLVTPISATGYCSGSILAFDLSTPVYDKERATDQAFTSSVQLTSLTPSNANNLFIVGSFGDEYGPQTADSGFTVGASTDKVGFTNESTCIAYLIQTTATAQSPTLSGSSNDANTFGCNAVIFTYTGGGATLSPYAHSSLKVNQAINRSNSF